MRKQNDSPLLLIGSLCLPQSGRSTVTFLPEKASAPAAPSPGFSLLIPPFEDPFYIFFFLLQHLLFFPPLSFPLLHPDSLHTLPASALYRLPSSFHTLIACISHRSPLANCIIQMVFLKIVRRG